MFNVSVLETRSVINAVFERYGFDISHYAMASLRLRIGMILNNHNLIYTDELIGRLIEEPDFLETFIREISVGSPDMFRDAELWIELRDHLLPGLLKEYPEFDILVPSSVTGDELCSAAILLRESGWSNKIRLITTCINHATAEHIRTAAIPQVRYKNSLENYRIFNPDGNLEDYVLLSDGKIARAPDLFRNIRFEVKKPTALPIGSKTRLILFRNRMLYMNQSMQRKVLTGIADRMNTGTCLIIGIKESIKGSGLENILGNISTDLNIYTRESHE